MQTQPTETKPVITAKIINEGIAEFIQRHRRPIVFTGVFLLLLFAGILATLSIREMMQNRAVLAVEDLQSRHEALRPNFTNEFFAHDVQTLLEDLTYFARRNSMYAGARAWSLAASIYSEKEDWDNAEEAFVQAALAARNTYLAALSWFNAAASAEQRTDMRAAIAHYENSLGVPLGFPQAPRAQFSIGRLHEALGETNLAMEAYRAVISGWPFDQVWSNLAQSRIITLEIRQ